ncbi:MAG: hypothetical protein GYA46_02600 [candidate division Zixibacteria bacterium]|nr:hypothetical protein [candidate division Zixibacteria bacterium]
MPVLYDIDHKRKLVIARGCGVMTMTDLFAYHKEVWSRADVIGYGEIVDITGIDVKSTIPTNEIIDLAKTAAADDAVVGSTRLAIVATGDLFFGLGRMYQAYRETTVQSRKKVNVFRSMDEAMAWIGQ